jgi:hypothetical protein
VNFPNDGLVATAEEEVVNETAESLNGKECEDNEADDLVVAVVTACLFGSSVLAIEKTTLIGHCMVLMRCTYVAQVGAQVDSCSKTDNDEAVSRGLNNTMTNHAVA